VEPPAAARSLPPCAPCSTRWAGIMLNSAGWHHDPQEGWDSKQMLDLSAGPFILSVSMATRTGSTFQSPTRSHRCSRIASCPWFTLPPFPPSAGIRWR
jgi:hypothetical protein